MRQCKLLVNHTDLFTGNAQYGNIRHSITVYMKSGDFFLRIINNQKHNKISLSVIRVPLNNIDLVELVKT